MIVTLVPFEDSRRLGDQRTVGAAGGTRISRVDWRRFDVYHRHGQAVLLKQP